MSDSPDTGDPENKSVSRRGMLKAGGAAIAAALMPKSVKKAVAQSTEPRIQLGPDYAIDDETQGDGSTDIIFEHQPSGAELRFDQSEGHWVPNQPINVPSGLTDGSTTVYDGSTDTVGDGTTKADHQSVNTGELSLAQSDARIYLSAGTTTIQSGNITVVPFDAIENEDSDILTVDTSNHTVTVQQAGTYYLSVNVYWDDSTNWSNGDTAWARLYLNNSRLTNFANPKTGTSNETVDVDYLDKFAAGDTLDVRVNQDSGSDQVLIGGSDASLSRFEVWRVA